MDVSTVPEVVIDDVIFPSTLSEADAPGSVIVKVSPTVKLIVGEVKVIVGASVSATTSSASSASSASFSMASSVSLMLAH